MKKNEENTKVLNLFDELTLEDEEREIRWQKGKFEVYEANDSTYKIIDEFAEVNNKKTFIKENGEYNLTCKLWKNLTNFVELFGEEQVTPKMFKELDSKKHKKKVYLDISMQINSILKDYLTLGYTYTNTEERYLNSMNRKQRRTYNKEMKKIFNESDEIIDEKVEISKEEYEKLKAMKGNQGE